MIMGVGVVVVPFHSQSNGGSAMCGSVWRGRKIGSHEEDEDQD